MGSSRKRRRREVDTSSEAPCSSTQEVKSQPYSKEPQNESLLHRVRNSWQFANLCQWIYIFGKAVKIDENINVDVLESACLNSNSTLLLNVGLSLLKHVSSHRGLNPELFDEYTRRQYLAKAPRRNPFGTDETPAKFAQFDVLTKLRVLQQLTRWVMLNPDRIRGRMGDHRDVDQTSWRVEAFGWDGRDRTYFVLDDNRLYRMTEPPAVSPPKKNTIKAKAARRASKRRRVLAADSARPRDTGYYGDYDTIPAPQPGAEDDYDRLGGMKWECIAVTLDDVRKFVASMRRTRDDNEKVLRGRLEEFLIPALEEQEESRKRKAAQRERELLALEKMAHAKRSSRIAGRIEQQRLAEKAREEEERRLAAVQEEASEKARRIKLEEERNTRLISRAQRLKEREARRLQHEEDLAQLSGDSRSQTGRISQRQLQRQIQMNKAALRQLEKDEDDWIFDCVCGVHGHVDDGTHSIACERCNVWQHSKCVGISQREADKEDFNFFCSSCAFRHKAADGPSSRPRPVIKLKVKNPDSSPESSVAKTTSLVGGGSQGTPPMARWTTTEAATAAFRPILNTPAGFTKAPPNPFSSPHPTIFPPQQSPMRSRAYSSIFEDSSPSLREAAVNSAEATSTPRGSGSAAHVMNDENKKSNGGRPRSHSPTGNTRLGKSVSVAAPMENGVSPIKSSPPAPAPAPTVGRKGPSPVSGSQAPSVLPPVASLSPSFRQPILTPPVKQQSDQSRLPR